ncbi:hypothetical protein BJY01DRAFT_230514 [Aspergillus pseudoustus]|uniref:Uncharacterized protein n=1 Tax=Aspergillus pseudoustus TaxID=1810923 RepID=A0ABR4I993_9EURO
MPPAKEKQSPKTSPLSDAAIKAFKASWPTYHQQCSPLINPLLRYLTDFFPINVDRPFSWLDTDNPHRRILRNGLIHRLQTGFRESKTCRFPFDSDWDHDVFVHVLAWWFSDPAAVEVRATVEKEVHAEVVDVEIFNNGIDYEPERVSHCFERAHPEFPVPGVPMKKVEYNPGSFYGEVGVGGGARKEFLKEKRKRKRKRLDMLG